MTLYGKTILITGGTNGIGKATALALARLGATVVIVGRDEAKTARAVAEIKTQSGSASVEFIIADLSSMADVRRAAAEFRTRYANLHVLVNNAGGIFDQRRTTADGYEMTFALNHLAYFLLTTLLLDMLKASAPARIVNVASDAHKTGAIDFDEPMHARDYDMLGSRAYSASKLANIMFTYELARRLEGSGVTVNALHPGMVATGLTGSSGRLLSLITFIARFVSLSAEKGAMNSVYVASSPDVEGVSGKYFARRAPIASSKASYDEAAQQRLWAVSEELTAIAIS